MVDLLDRLVDQLNRRGFNRPLRLVRKRDVTRMYWWRPEGFKNAGDEVGPFLFQHFTGRLPLRVEPSNWSLRTVVMSAGSIIREARADTIVWGSGIISRSISVEQPHQICAVRGPETWDHLMRNGIDCPEVFGDPGLLLPLAVPKAEESMAGIGYVPHYVDHERVPKDLAEDPDVAFIDITGPLETVIQKITSCDRIVSSSLHGLIFSHAYGLPASRIRPLGRLAGDDVKFQDYNTSVGIEDRVFDNDGSIAALRDAAKQATRPSSEIVQGLQQGLLDSCPFLT